MKKYFVRVNGISYEVEIEEVGTGRMVPQMVPNYNAGAVDSVKANENRAEDNTGNTTVVSSPMPGTVLKLNVQVGSRVTKGQVLLILEAMKMENEITAPSDGIVKNISTKKGAQVEAGDQLITLTKSNQ